VSTPRESADRSEELRLEVPAAHSSERGAREALRKFAKQRGVAQSEVDTMEFVASELLSNAVDHGGGNHAMDEKDVIDGVRITLVVSIERGTWQMEVGDQGGGDPEEVERLINNDDDVPDLEDERGRGFFLLKQMVDSLHVTRSADGLGLAITAVRRYAERS
jgi:anti-sigma regulatory factor (Ser/Thr protein kinase)